MSLEAIDEHELTLAIRSTPSPTFLTPSGSFPFSFALGRSVADLTTSTAPTPVPLRPP